MKILDYIRSAQSAQKQCLDVINPYDNKVICAFNTNSVEDVHTAINVASKAFKTWSQSGVQYRTDILHKWHQNILDNIDELARIITLENGKTIAHAKREVRYAASFVNWCIHSLYNVQGRVKYGNEHNRRMITEYEPIGVVGAITPWNFPMAMVTKKLSNALAAGCTVVLKPSEITPLSSFALLKLARDAGIPEGIINIVCGDSHSIAETLCNDFRVRQITFTGSTSVGKSLYHHCASGLKRISLELGGNAPYIVFKDSNIEKAIDNLVESKISSSGQSCTAPNRIFVERSIYHSFINSFYKKFSTLQVGNGLDEQSDYGPLINASSVIKLFDLIDDAQSKGAEVLCGGTAQGNLFSPTILKNCNESMSIFKTEIFGPVVAFYTFDHEDEVIARANATEYGLQSYIYAGDHQVINRVSSQLDFSIVTINDAFASNCRASFTGRKASGFGFEGGDEGIFEYLNTKYINIVY